MILKLVAIPLIIKPIIINDMWLGIYNISDGPINYAPIPYAI